MITDTSPSPITQLDPRPTAAAPSIRPSGRQAVALAIVTLVLLPLVSACGITSQTDPSSPPSHGPLTHVDAPATQPRADENEADEDDNEGNAVNENERDENERGD